MITKSMRFLLGCGLALTEFGGSVAWADLGLYQTVSVPAARSSTHLMHPLVNAAQMAANANTRAGSFSEVDDGFVIPVCENRSNMVDPSSYWRWLDMCDPQGIVITLNEKYGSFQQWSLPYRRPADGSLAKDTSLRNMAAYMANDQASILTILNGRGDHWIAIYGMVFDFAVPMLADVKQVKFNYGYQAVDSANRPISLTASMSGGMFGGLYSHLNIVRPISSPPGLECTGCIDTCPSWDSSCSCTPCPDPFIDNYVFLHGTPRYPTAATGRLGATTAVQWTRSPGFLPAGQTLTPERATRDVWEALRSSQVPLDETLATKLHAATAGESYRVAGRLSDGQAMDYIVVPMLDASGHNALLFIELDVADGAVRSITNPSQDFAYQPIAAQEAAQTARSLLKEGEQLGTPGLGWDARESHPAAAHTFAAFWEFPIERDAQTTDEVVRVVRNGGFLIGRATLGGLPAGQN